MNTWFEILIGTVVVVNISLLIIGSLQDSKKNMREIDRIDSIQRFRSTPSHLHKNAHGKVGFRGKQKAKSQVAG